MSEDSRASVAIALAISWGGLICVLAYRAIGWFGFGCCVFGACAVPAIRLWEERH